MKVQKINNLIVLAEDILKTIIEDKFLAEEIANINKLNSTKHKLKDRKYTISVIAAMKAGKSTTFNALIGRDLLPNERAACTASITEIKHNKQEGNYIEKIFTDGTKEKIQATSEKTLEEMFHEDVRNSRKQDGVKHIGKYYLETPIKALEGTTYENLLQNFVLVDTPGPNEASTKDFDTSILQKLALEQLTNSDALIMLLDYESYKSEANAKILKDIFENRDDLEKEQHKVYFIINKIDSMGPKDGTVEDVIKSVQQLIREYAPVIKEPKVYAISGRQAQFARCVINNTANEDMKEQMSNEYGSLFAEEIEFKGKQMRVIPEVEDFAKQLFEKSNLDTVEQEIISTVFEKASDEMIENALGRISSVLENIIGNADSKIEILNKSSEELYKVVEETKNEINKLKESAVDLNSIPNEEFRQLESKISEIIYSIQSNVESTLEQVLPYEDTITSHDKDGLSIRMQDMKKNAISAIQVSLNREIDRIQRLCMESQYKLNVEISKKFNELVKEATKSASDGINFTTRTFDIQETIDMYNDASDYIDVDYESEGTYTDYEWDTKSAIYGTGGGTIAGAATGAAIGSVIPVIGTVVGGIAGAVLGGLGGLIFGSQKETQREIKKEVYTADINALKSSIIQNSRQILSNSVQEINTHIEQFKTGYMNFVNREIAKFLKGLDRDLDNIIKNYEDEKYNKDKEVNHMIDIKYKVAEYIDNLENIKNM